MADILPTRIQWVNADFISDIINKCVFSWGFAFGIGFGFDAPTEQFAGIAEDIERPIPHIQHPIPDAAFFTHRKITGVGLDPDPASRLSKSRFY
jgi:hypothetical protein